MSMINVPILGDLIREVGATVREILPDGDKRLEIEVRLAELADRVDQRENALLLAQTEVNKVEAASSNMFVAGWRPFIGWVCGGSLAYTWVLAPILKTVFRLQELPVIQPDQIYPVVLAMLGVAGMRTFEKTKGVATSIGGKVLVPKLPTPVESQNPPIEIVQSIPEAPKRKGRWFK